MKILSGVRVLLLIGLLLMFATNASFAAEAPPNIASALMLKLISFEKQLNKSGELSIFVLGSPAMATELSKAQGKQIGKAVLKSVVEGNTIPAQKPSIIFVGDASKLAEATAYSRAEKILSVTNLPNLAEKGITLNIGVGDDGKPSIVLNLTSSKAEGLDWNPAIMKIAKTVK